MMNFDETLPTEMRWTVSKRINDAFCPDRWERIRLHDIATVQNGFAFKSEFFSKNGSGDAYPLIRIRDVGKADTETYYSGDLEAEYVVRKGDIVIGMDGEFRCRKWLGRDALLNQRVCRLLPDNEEVGFEFFFKLIQPYLDAVEKVTSSVTVTHLSSKTVADLEFPLPPLAEQRRIVSKIESLQERSSRARRALSEVGPLLEQFRQSVLRAAFSGRLTADWRAAHRDVEPASELLSRIRTERRHRWEQSELAKYGAKDKKPPKNWQDKYKEPEPVDEDVLAALPALPDGWCWSTWESILSLDVGTFKRGPFGSTLKKSIFVSSGYKVYEQYCPINDDCSYVRYYITPEKFAELKAFAVQARDFLISCSGVTLGRITQVPDEFEEGVINQALLRVRLNNQVYDDPFFKWLFRSPFFQKQIFDNSQGGAIPNVKGVKDLKAIPVPVPPLDEQAVVVERLLDQLEAIDEISEQVAESKSALTQLDQSILAKAFRGELVPQDPRDEPASELLARIRTTRENAAASKPKKKRASNKRSTTKTPHAANEPAITQTTPFVSANGKLPSTPEPAAPVSEKNKVSKTATTLDEYSTDEIMSEFRSALWGESELEETEFLRAVAERLGFGRLGKNIRQTLKNHLRAAIRRQIIERDGDYVSCPTSIFRNYEHDFLVDSLKSVLKKGREYTREEVTYNIALHLGFSNVTDAMRTHMKPVFNSAIRRKKLGHKGQYVWREE